MSPPCPDVDVPVPRAIIPESPRLDVPVLSEIPPLTPASPAFGVRKENDPDEVCEENPVEMAIYPPDAPELSVVLPALMETWPPSP
mmetsp:Transcript_6414/g.11060  ORF Transcript_6414/g.11060 Transcript_6414/m.11060 type:complete len:86 (+) Transcript_6414:20177-20434(+)